MDTSISQDSRPNPDPTLLTTQQLLREMANERELALARLETLRAELKSELISRDKALELQQSVLDKFQQIIDEKVQHLKAIHDEKFQSIQTQFAERDVRTEQTSRDSKVAVDAALQAAKEAVGEQNKSSALAIAKSEAATTKQIDQQGLLISSSTAGLNDKIDDIKDRLTRIEGEDKGVRVVKEDGRATVGLIVGALGFIIAVIALLVRLVTQK